MQIHGRTQATETIGRYVTEHVERGECKCGKCIDVGSKPDPAAAHTADLIFFKAAIKGQPSREEFEQLTRQHAGEFGPCNPLDGEEHGYIELGGWIGDQGIALEYMALGYLLGVFDLLTPRTVLGEQVDEKLAMEMAGAGYVTVKLKARSC